MLEDSKAHDLQMALKVSGNSAINGLAAIMETRPCSDFTSSSCGHDGETAVFVSGLQLRLQIWNDAGTEQHEDGCTLTRSHWYYLDLHEVRAPQGGRGDVLLTVWGPDLSSGLSCTLGGAGTGAPDGTSPIQSAAVGNINPSSATSVRSIYIDDVSAMGAN